MSGSSSSLLNIFISHKHEYRTEAQDIKEKLYYRGAGRIQLFLSNEIPAGTDWRHWIESSLGESNILLLLFMNPSSSWDWCLYEAGLFNGLNKGHIVVLHNPDTEPPAPLRHLQAVKANIQDVKKFLKTLFGVNGYGISQAINRPYVENDADLETDANEICALFSASEPDIQYLTRKIILHVDFDNLSRKKQIPADSRIEADQETLSLFGLIGRIYQPWTWGDLAKRINDSNWVEDLENSICEASQGQRLEPSKISFQADGKIFFPTLYRFDQGIDRTLRFHILLIENVTEGIVAYAPETLATLLSTLTLGSRFQWELCTRYLEELQRWSTHSAIENGCRAIRESFDNIQREAELREKREFHGNRDRDRLIWAFESFEDQRYIGDNLTQQARYKQDLIEALEDENLQQIEHLLKTLQRLNMLLVVRISKRYAELLKRIPRYGDSGLDSLDV